MSNQFLKNLAEMTARNLLAATLLQNKDLSDCPWMAYAIAEAGITEAPGEANNPRVVEYLQTCGGFSKDSVAWCSAFVNWCMTNAGYKGTGAAGAWTWRAWGVPLVAPKFGAVTVFKKAPNTEEGSGHVSFYYGIEGDNILVFGGNQNDAVNVKAYPKSRLFGYRWPA